MALSSRVLYATGFFALLMTWVVVLRPSAVFAEDGRPRPFGTAPGATMYPLGVITVVAAAISLYIFAFIDAFVKD